MPSATVLKKPRKSPPAATAKTVLDTIEKLRSAVDEISTTAIEDLQEQIKALEVDKADLRDQIGYMRDSAGDVLREATDDLERIRQWVQAGKTGDAIRALNRLLGEYDPGKKSAGIRAVML